MGLRQRGAVCVFGFLVERGFAEGGEVGFEGERGGLVGGGHFGSCGLGQ